MRTQALAIALLCVVAVGTVSAQSISGSLAFKAGVNVTLDSNTAAQFALRSTVMIDLTFGIPNLHAVSFGSFAIAGSGNQQGGQISGDAIFGAAYSFLNVPVTWLGYYSANRSISLTSANFYTSTLDQVAGFICSAYTRLIERDPSGNQVTALSLKGGLSFTWSRSAISTSGDIKYMTILGRDNNRANFNILITFVVSDKVGILEYGNTAVQPRSIETIIEINNWPYANSQNTLSLEIVAGSGSASGAGREFVSSLRGPKVYLRAASGVSVDGRDGVVSTTAWVDASFAADLDGLGGLRNQLEGAYAGSATLKKCEIKFPAGAAKIVYDPTLGQGEMLNSAMGRVASIAAIALVALLAMLFM